ncbi:MAG TPA: L-glutamate gamma-semialdehyde dehydrogenase [Thermoanaerobaculia bacterium]|nr:L-glutamate gamma-semialdehyde dehydrogenase [Thermoanaerobaculia bacterium]
MFSEFRNEPLTDFTAEANRRAFADALERVRGRLPLEGRLFVGGRWTSGAATFESRNPSRKDDVIGRFAKGTRADALRAVDAAFDAFAAWRNTPSDDRSRLLVRIAAILRNRKHEFSAMMSLEAGKTWPEADGDTAEAIDFCEFYAREMHRLSEPQPLTPVPGERGTLEFLPLGVGAIIPPWNFPLAILAGMTTAAIVSGNTVVLKPASDTAGIATMFVEAAIEAGVPAGVLNFVTGPGAEVGDALVESPKVRFIAFTGSKTVGLEINEKAAKVPKGQIWIKRAILEMGGKDFILVDETADLDSAAAGVVASAFGFQGQKCSACSRLIVVDSVHDELVAKVVEKTKALKLGPADDPASSVGPVINAGAQRKILEYVEAGKKEGKLLAGGGAGPDSGFYVQPTVIDDVSRDAKIAREEIFGPVLAILRARDFDEGVALANDTEYGLTGALYSRDPARIARGKRDLFCGNLYVNRKCTGALVGAHPFGGFNMSGTDSKAGGREYLYLFTQAKAIAEKISETAPATSGEKSKGF